MQDELNYKKFAIVAVSLVLFFVVGSFIESHSIYSLLYLLFLIGYAIRYVVIRKIRGNR